MQSWSQHFTETAGKDCMGFGNVAWLAKNFIFLDCDQLSLTGCCVKCRAAVSVLVSADFHSKERISLYFFDVKDLIHIYRSKQSDQMLLR